MEKSKRTNSEPKANSTWERLEDFVREHVQRFIWADGLYVKAGLGNTKTTLLVMIGAFSDGQKVVLATASGQRESKES